MSCHLVVYTFVKFFKTSIQNNNLRPEMFITDYKWFSFREFTGILAKQN